MSEAPLGRHLALRIGRAARALPGIDAGRLIEILGEAVGLPLTQSKLDGLGRRALRRAGGADLLAVPPAALAAALDHLKGVGCAEDEPAPAVAPGRDDDMPESIRVACASNGGEVLDGHFGSCARFLVYQLSAADCRLIEVREAMPPADCDDRTAWRAGLIADCHLLHVVSIGGPAAARVVRAGVHPVRHPEGGPARDVLAKLQAVLAGTPPPWLARIIGRRAETLAPFGEPGEE